MVGSGLVVNENRLTPGEVSGYKKVSMWCRPKNSHRHQLIYYLWKGGKEYFVKYYKSDNILSIAVFTDDRLFFMTSKTMTASMSK